MQQSLSASLPAHLGAWGPESLQRRACTLPEALAYCRQLVRAHYENFTVASLLLPASLRQHFANIYAYCRWADDLADEVADRDTSLRLLDWWQQQLEACYRGQAQHPVFVALGTTIAKYGIPPQPFVDLLSAFRQDRQKRGYDTFDEVLDYCRRSANPVGRLVLYVIGAHDEQRAHLADQICTGLQLANFCQDVAEDYARGRIYIARETLDRFHCPPEALAQGTPREPARQVLAHEVERAAAYLQAGLPLVNQVSGRYRVDIALFAEGGLSILQKIRSLRFDVWQRRPTLSHAEKLRLGGQVLLKLARGAYHLPRAASPVGASPQASISSSSLPSSPRPRSAASPTTQAPRSATTRPSPSPSSQPPPTTAPSTTTAPTTTPTTPTTTTAPSPPSNAGPANAAGGGSKLAVPASHNRSVATRSSTSMPELRSEQSSEPVSESPPEVPPQQPDAPRQQQVDRSCPPPSAGKRRGAPSVLATNAGVAASYEHCHQIARRAARNFYYTFLFLPPAKRRSMFALYAFMRRADDLADDERAPIEQRRRDLRRWREAWHAALQGRFTDPMLPAVADTVRRWHIAPQYLEDVIDGVEMDLDKNRYATFGELLVYCHRVASAVGLASLAIWGFDRRGQSAAIDCGIAFQLTNILRDLREDAAADRVYLPLEDLDRFGYTIDDLKRGVDDPRFRRLLRYEIDRARQYFQHGWQVLDFVDADARAICRTMIRTYETLLDQIDSHQHQVLRQRLRLSRTQKLRIAAGAWWHRGPRRRLRAGRVLP